MENLIIEIESILEEIRSGNLPSQAIAAEIIKIGLLMEIAGRGPDEAISGLIFLTRQLADQFPEHFKIVKNELSFPEPVGSA